MQNTIRVRVPASSANLGPGFDALGLALQLFNHVELSLLSSDDGVTVEGEGAAFLPRDGSNIALRAARALLEQNGAPATGLQLHLHNAVPPARGLGSSSAARVGALVAANELCRAQGWKVASPSELVALASRLEGHPDNVAAALLGGLVASSDDAGGALATRVPVARFPGLAVFIPDAHVPTSEARAVLPAEVSRADAVFNIGRTALLLAALTSGDFSLLPHALQDRLHQEQRAPLMPGFAATRRAALEAGALGVTLSGAGPTVLAWLPPDADAAHCALLMQESAMREGVAGRAQPLRVDEQGCVPLA